MQKCGIQKLLLDRDAPTAAESNQSQRHPVHGSDPGPDQPASHVETYRDPVHALPQAAGMPGTAPEVEQLRGPRFHRRAQMCRRDVRNSRAAANAAGFQREGEREALSTKAGLPEAVQGVRRGAPAERAFDAAVGVDPRRLR